MDSIITWCDTSDDSRRIISPRDYIVCRGTSDAATFPRCLVMFEASAAIPHIVATYAVEERYSPLPGFLGDTPVYALKNNRDLGFMQGAFGAPGAACNLESAIALGCKSLFVFGQCGGVAPETSVGDIVVPTEVVREEGTSFHYTSDEGNALPDGVLLNDLKEHLATCTNPGTRIHIGKTVTTDAVFRQTIKKELRWRTQGILGVEMELSALLSVARHHGVPAVGLLVVSDKHDLEGEDPWRWGAKEYKAKRLQAVDLLIGFAYKVCQRKEET